MTDKLISNDIRALRISQRPSQEVAKTVEISPKTVGPADREGHEHHLRRIGSFLKSLAASPAAGGQSVRTFIEQASVPGAKPLSLAFHELAAMLDRLPAEQQAPAVTIFLDVQRELDDAALDALKTLEATAQITVKAFSQCAR